MIDGDIVVNIVREPDADSERWKKLIRLCGSTKDGSDMTVKLFWDDATHTPFIVVGIHPYYSDHGSFAAVIDSIPEEVG